jgi:transcriptional regulator of arginine metabolism
MRILEPRMPTDLQERDRRRSAIVALLRRGHVGSQEELAEKLHARGIETTQPSLSRDLRELGVGKVGGRYVLPGADAAQADEVLAEVLDFVREAKPAGPHLIVVTTTVGAAQPVAIALDRAAFPEVVGTVAGDDTIFAACRSAAEQKRLIERLRRLLGERRSA